MSCLALLVHQTCFGFGCPSAWAQVMCGWFHLRLWALSPACLSVSPIPWLALKWQHISDGVCYRRPTDHKSAFREVLRKHKAAPGPLSPARRLFVRNPKCFFICVEISVFFPPVLLMSSMWEQAGGSPVLTERHGAGAGRLEGGWSCRTGVGAEAAEGGRQGNPKNTLEGWRDGGGMWQCKGCLVYTLAGAHGLTYTGRQAHRHAHAQSSFTYTCLYIHTCEHIHIHMHAEVLTHTPHGSFMLDSWRVGLL